MNQAISQEWLFGPLQFVAGLGPRKAALLKAHMVAETAVNARNNLREEPFNIGEVVFTNAATAIRLRSKDDILDDTRIHPDDYKLAFNIAMEA